MGEISDGFAGDLASSLKSQVYRKSEADGARTRNHRIDSRKAISSKCRLGLLL
jgi:hypothetical protein